MPETDTQIALLQKQIEAGFGDFGRRFDDLKESVGELGDRLHHVELQVAKDQVAALREEVDSWSSKIVALEVRSAIDSARAKIAIAGAGFAGSIFGAVVTHLLSKV